MSGSRALLPFITGHLGDKIQERFWEKVDRCSPGDCWEWTAYRKPSGYGQFKVVSYITVFAHRFALIASLRAEHEDLCVLHSCDNPSCCNPNHLRFGTKKENAEDMYARNRANPKPLTGTDNPRAKLSYGELEAVISALTDGLTDRQIVEQIAPHVTDGAIRDLRFARTYKKECAQLGWEGW